MPIITNIGYGFIDLSFVALYKLTFPPNTGIAFSLHFIVKSSKILLLSPIEFSG